MLAVALTGLALFFAPWLEMLKPERVVVSGFALAKGVVPWLWAGPVAWFVTVPLILTRTTVSRLLGIRLIAALFASLTLVDVVLLAIVPASGGGRVPVAFTWSWGYWMSGPVALLGIFAATRLGRTPSRRAPKGSGKPDADTAHGDAKRPAEATLH